MLSSIVALLVCTVGDSTPAAFVQQTFSSAQLAKLSQAELLEAAFASGVIPNSDPKAPGAAELLALRERAAGAGSLGAYSGNPAFSVGFAGLPPLGPITVGTSQEREPNDTRAWADAVGCGTFTGSIDYAYDSDFVQLEFSQPTLLRAATSAGPAPLTDDTLLELTDERGGFLLFDDDSGPGFYSLLQVTLAPGRYYLRVSGFLDSVGGYTLTTTCTPATLPVFTPGTPLPGSTSAAQPLRVYSLALAEDRQLTLRCNGSGGFDPLLLLRNATGAAIVFNDDAASGVLAAEIRAHLPAGDYQLWVFGFGGQSGNYTLQTNANAALPLPAGCVSGAGTLGSKHEWDFYRCELPAGMSSMLEFAPQAVAGGANDTIVTLYDASLRQITSVDDSAGSLFAPLNLPLVGGTYYAAVSSFDGSSATVGAYGIAANCADPAPVLDLACNSVAEIALTSAGTGRLARVVSATGQPVELRALNEGYPGNPLDSVALLLDADGRVLDWNDDADGSFGSAAGAHYGPGTAHALVLGYQGLAIGQSELRVACSFAVLGDPLIGKQIFHASRAKAGDRVLGFGAAAPAVAPFAVAGLAGLCLLDSSSAENIGYYKMGPVGSQLVALRVPPSPGLVGVEYWMQNANVDEVSASGWFSNAVSFVISAGS